MSDQTPRDNAATGATPTRKTDSTRASLIINADDYGYFHCVSRGIIAAAECGAVTATGIMANSPALTSHLIPLRERKGLDCGVHLNLTYGEPLTRGLRNLLSRSAGKLPTKSELAAGVLTGHIPLARVAEEWRQQIRRCLDGGVRLRFLNSHEHVHMLPPLFKISKMLKEEFAIPHLRYTAAEWHLARRPGDWFRNVALASLALTVRPWRIHDRPISFLGAGISGRLTLEYLQRRLPSLKPGLAYELMCHPGYFDPNEIKDRHLQSYHAWEQELSVLCSPDLRDLFRAHNVRLTTYRALPGD